MYHQLSPAQELGRESAMENLQGEIRRLPFSADRTRLEIEFCWLWRVFLRLPEKPAVARYQNLRQQVTQTRFKIADQVIRDLETRLAQLGGLVDWNRSPIKAQLAIWRAGQAQDQTVEAYLAKTNRFIVALYKAIAAEEMPRATNRGIRTPGKTLREEKKRALRLGKKK